MVEKDKVLIIDDELAPRESLRMVLKDKFDVFTAPGAPEGMMLMDENPVDLVVLDIRMPGMDGITALSRIKERDPSIEVILLTAYASVESARDAIRLGAFDYLMKPFDKDDLINVVEKGLEKKKDSERVRAKLEDLTNMNNILEEQISIAQNNIINGYEGTVKALNLTIDAKDHYTFNHSNRVVKFSSALSTALGLSSYQTEKLEHAAAIHDIGKIGVDEQILRKPGNLNLEEFEEIKKHPEIGARIVQSVPFLKEAVPVILYHHERYDGKGYPEGLKAEQVPLGARIIIVADAVDSMMHDRPYRNRLKQEEVMSELSDNSGTQFDPKITDLILNGKIMLQ
jgi:response regulator RpfG family c-di-GMP phosphodiesterase